MTHRETCWTKGSKGGTPKSVFNEEMHEFSLKVCCKLVSVRMVLQDDDSFWSCESSEAGDGWSSEGSDEETESQEETESEEETDSEEEPCLQQLRSCFNKGLSSKTECKVRLEERPLEAKQRRACTQK